MVLPLASGMGRPGFSAHQFNQPAHPAASGPKTRMPRAISNMLSRAKLCSVGKDRLRIPVAIHSRDTRSALPNRPVRNARRSRRSVVRRSLRKPAHSLSSSDPSFHRAMERVTFCGRTCRRGSSNRSCGRRIALAVMASAPRSDCPAVVESKGNARAVAAPPPRPTAWVRTAGAIHRQPQWHPQALERPLRKQLCAAPA